MLAGGLISAVALIGLFRQGVRPSAPLVGIAVLILGMSLIALGVWKPERAVAVVGGFLTVLTGVVTISQVLLPGAAAPTTTPPNASPSTPATAACVRLPQKPDALEVLPESSGFDLRFSDVTVEVTGREQLYLRMAGRITGSVPPRTRLVLLMWTDPNSHDSTSKHNPGNGMYYLRVKEVRFDASGCWVTDTGKWVYKRAAGLRFRFYFTLVPEASVPELEHIRAQRMGDAFITPTEAEVLGLQKLASFDIQTKPLTE